MGIKAAVGILTVLAILAGPANAQEMMVLTEESPPYNFTRDGRITGSSTEIVREILRRLGEPDGIQVLPWARSYKLLNSRPNVALFSTTRTPEREDRFFWIGPLFTVHYGFYARKSSHLRIDSLEDAKKVGSIATYKDDVKEQLLKSMGFVNLDSSKSPASNLKKLMAGRVDLWLFDNVGVSDIARQQNADPAELELVLPFKSYQAYVAISRQTSEGIVRQWRSALQTMIDDGTFFEINHRWLPPESVPDLNAAKTYSDGAPTLKLYTEDSPPGSFSDNGKPAGFAVEIVREILKRRRHPDTIAIVPWSRGYTLAQSGPNVALFSTSRTEQRENRFHWVGPLYTQTWVLYGRKGADIRIRSLEDAKKIGRIGTYLRDAKGQYLQSMGFTNLVNTNRNSSNIRHLIEGNIDLWASSDFNMPYLARQAGFDPDDLEAVVPIRRVSNYIAFSLGTPLALVRDWQQCLDDIKMDGTYMRIARKHNYSIP